MASDSEGRKNIQQMTARLVRGGVDPQKARQKAYDCQIRKDRRDTKK